MESGIYQIRNLKNKKIYIGSSENINKRWNNHKYDLIRNKIIIKRDGAIKFIIDDKADAIIVELAGSAIEYNSKM